MGAVIAGANVHDTKLLAETIEAIVVERPKPTEEKPQNLCLDKAYDNRPAERPPRPGVTLRTYGGSGKRRRCRAEKKAQAETLGVERTHSWLSKCRAILIRYDKNSFNYLGLIQLACGLLWYRKLHRLAVT